MGTSSVDYPFYEGGYFMTSEQEAAAKWRTIEEYKAVKERYHALRQEITRWGEEFVRIGGIIQNTPEGIGVGQITGFPNQEKYVAAAKEVRELAIKFERLSDALRNLGVDPF